MAAMTYESVGCYDHRDCDCNPMYVYAPIEVSPNANIYHCEHDAL